MASRTRSYVVTSHGYSQYLEVERGMNVLGTVKHRAEDEKVHFLLLVRLYAVHAINMS